MRIAITTFLGFYLMLISTRYGDISTYGSFIILKSTSGFIGNLLSMRSSEAVTKFCKESEVNNDFKRAKSAIIVGFVSDIVIATLILFSIYLFSNFISVSFLKEPNLDYLVVIFGLTSFFAYLRGTIIGYLQVRDRYLNINILVSIESVLIIAYITFIVLNGDKIILNDLVYAHVVSYFFILFGFVFVFSMHYREHYKHVPCVINYMFVKEYLVFSMKTFTSTLLKAGNKNIDSLVISYLMTSSEVGYYQAIKKCFSLIEVVAQPWTMLSYSKLVGYYTERNIVKLKGYILQVTLKITIFSVLIGTPILYFIEDILKIIDGEIQGEVYAISSLLLLGYLTSASVWWGRVFSNVVNPNLSIYSNFGSLLYNLSVMYLLVKFFGILGAAISFLVINILIFLFFTYNYSKLNVKDKKK